MTFVGLEKPPEISCWVFARIFSTDQMMKRKIILHARSDTFQYSAEFVLNGRLMFLYGNIRP